MGVKMETLTKAEEEKLVETKRSAEHVLYAILRKKGLTRDEIKKCGIEVFSEGQRITYAIDKLSWFDHAKVLRHKETGELVIRTAPYQIYGNGLASLSALQDAGLKVDITTNSPYCGLTLDVLIYE
jgi:hypothetical protein